MHAQSRQEQVRHKLRTLTIRVRRAIARKLREERWSPEQISCWWRDERGVQLSQEWISRMVWDNQHAGGQRRDPRSDGQSPERPAVVTRTSRLGDWESDTLIGAWHKGALLPHCRAKTPVHHHLDTARPTAKAAHRATVHHLNPWRDHVHTITYDNGTEFAGHRQTAHILHAPVFCATPSHAWERGVNENTNGLIRDFFPKGTDCSTIQPATGAKVERLLNRRPRTSLEVNTPTEAVHALAKRG